MYYSIIFFIHALLLKKAKKQQNAINNLYIEVSSSFEKEICNWELSYSNVFTYKGNKLTTLLNEFSFLQGFVLKKLYYYNKNELNKQDKEKEIKKYSNILANPDYPLIRGDLYKIKDQFCTRRFDGLSDYYFCPIENDKEKTSNWKNMHKEDIFIFLKIVIGEKSEKKELLVLHNKQKGFIVNKINDLYFDIEHSHLTKVESELNEI